MTRQELIEKGKIWQVSYDKTPDDILFEGKSRSACLKYIKTHHSLRLFKSGTIRIGNVIWEP